MFIQRRSSTIRQNSLLRAGDHDMFEIVALIAFAVKAGNIFGRRIG